MVDEPTPEQLKARRKLGSAARQLQAARSDLDSAMSSAKAAAVAAMDLGTPESVVARELNVNRMTVRKWLGK